MLEITARLAGIVIPQLAHHVTQRGKRHLPVFFFDDDGSEYLRLVVNAASAGA